MLPVQRVMAAVACAAVGLAVPATAQWSSDPSVNLAIADRTADQVQPKIRSTSDGGCYISWFDNAGGGYDVYLQRLDPQGYEQWPHNGLLIANRSYGWTTDYELTVDADDNAVIAYNDDRSGSDQIGCNKISPAGTLLWGATGVLLTNTSEFVASPRVAVTSDGRIVVGWTQEAGFYLQQLSPDGVPQWASPTHVLPATGSYGLSDLKESGAGTVIASWVYSTGGYSSPRYLYAQKYSSAGAPVWGFAPVIVFDGGSLQMGYFPRFVPDGSGGAVFGWYDTAGTRNCYVQHVSTSGTQLFPHNGVAASTLANRIRLSPDVAYNSATGESFLFWTEANSLQSQWGLYGQKFSPAGVRAWTNSGVQLLPLTTQQNAFVKTVVAGTGAIVFYVDDAGAGYLKAFRLDGAGAVVWPLSPRMICATLSSKWGVIAARTPAGMPLVAWADQRVDSGNIYTQNVKPDGSLGLPALITGDLNCDGQVDFRDINPFVLYLSGNDLWQATYPTCPPENGDINLDGVFPSFADINPFVMLLSGKSSVE
ncbi:MAG: hypothetical protein KA383_19890 [Phycisphaerae bacterium]|nr:hypothetical protein [Phycisphaerae bacterium]